MKSRILIALINPAGLQRWHDFLVFKEQIIIMSIVNTWITKLYQAFEVNHSAMAKENTNCELEGNFWQMKLFKVRQFGRFSVALR